MVSDPFHMVELLLSNEYQSALKANLAKCSLMVLAHMGMQPFNIRKVSAVLAPLISAAFESEGHRVLLTVLVKVVYLLILQILNTTSQILEDLRPYGCIICDKQLLVFLLADRALFILDNKSQPQGTDVA